MSKIKRVKNPKKLTQFVKLKKSSQTQAKNWLRQHRNDNDIDMSEIPDYVFDFLNNKYKDNDEVNTTIDGEDEFAK